MYLRRYLDNWPREWLLRFALGTCAVLGLSVSAYLGNNNAILGATPSYLVIGLRFAAGALGLGAFWWRITHYRWLLGKVFGDETSFELGKALENHREFLSLRELLLGLSVSALSASLIWGKDLDGFLSIQGALVILLVAGGFHILVVASFKECLNLSDKADSPEPSG